MVAWTSNTTRRWQPRRRLWPLGTPGLLLPCLLAVTTGCGASGPSIVTVGEAEVRTCEEVESKLGLEPGSLGEVGCFVVSDGWMIRRVETEQALEAALDDCLK